MSELSDADWLRNMAEEERLIYSGLRPMVRLRAIADRLETLERRLELTATAEDGSTVRLEIGDCDGIGCRDETIRQQDKRIEALERENARLSEVLEKIAGVELPCIADVDVWLQMRGRARTALEKP